MPESKLHRSIASWIIEELETRFDYGWDWRGLFEGFRLPDIDRKSYYRRHHFKGRSDAVIAKQKRIILRHIKESRRAFLLKNLRDSLINLGIALHYIQDILIPHDIERNTSDLAVPPAEILLDSVSLLQNFDEVALFLNRRVNRDFLRHMGLFGPIPYLELYAACYVSITIAKSILSPNPRVDELRLRTIRCSNGLNEEAMKLELVEELDRYDKHAKKRYAKVQRLNKEIARFVKDNNTADQWYMIPDNVVEEIRMEIESKLPEDEIKRIEMLPGRVKKHERLRRR